MCALRSLYVNIYSLQPQLKVEGQQGCISITRLFPHVINAEDNCPFANSVLNA
jgi:hypothetical protein